MAFENRNGWHRVAAVWLVAAVITAFGAGYFCSMGLPWWVLFSLCSIGCGVLTIKGVKRVGKQIRYVIEATMSGDFSYRFPTTAVKAEEREINEELNRIVDRFEQINVAAGQNEAFLKRVINLTDVGMAVADSEGNVILHNDATLRFLDRQALTHVCQLPERGCTDLVIKQSGLTVREKGFSVFTINDLSRQMQAVEVESLEKLTRVLTHEIMNSLTPIQSIAETMSGKLEAEEQTSVKNIADAFGTISSSSRGLMQFVKNFREFTKLPDPKMRVFYLKPLLESCVRLGMEYAKGKGVRISLLCFPPDVMVYTDESLLSRVLLNIVKNAIEANPSAVRIESNLKIDESIEIRIANDGEPISEKDAEHIFTPFFTTRTAGSGIGLSLSRRIINHLGGTLTLKTRPLTCFTVRL